MDINKLKDCIYEISDLSGTAVITDQMTLDEVIGYFCRRLSRIEDLAAEVQILLMD